jgi:MoaA/NifB/PqqE/SkfB family radical SAM enzyme
MQIANRRDRTPISRLTLQITDACNLQCIYCFTGNKACADTFVSAEDFGYFLGFTLRNGMRGIRLTGGETMLHPHVHRFVHLAVRAGMPVHIFSNFTIKDSIEGFDAPGRELSFLVNVNDREKYDDTAWDSLAWNLELAEQRGYQTVLGYTVHTAPFSIPHIVTLASVYNISKIRVSPAKPTIGAANKSLALADMHAFAESVVRLAQELESVGKQLVLDCPIPFCHIPQEYLPFFTRKLKLTGKCGFGTSVNVNLEVGHCYVTNSLLAKRNLRSFKDVAEMVEYMRGQMKTLDQLCPQLSHCSDCLYGKQGVCAGGCYGLLHKAACREDVVNG